MICLKSEPRSAVERSGEGRESGGADGEGGGGQEERNLQRA